MKNTLGAIKTRLVYLKLFITGNLCFSLTAFYILPAFMRPRIDSVKSFKIFGKKFITPVGARENRNLLNFVYEVIAQNQYHIELIPKGAVVIDAGANMGVFSVFVAATRPDTTIYAFEPAPATFEALKENTKEYSNVKVFNAGLGESERMDTVVITNHSGGNYIGAGGVPVKIMTVDGLNLPVGFMKMDTEGFEANIIKGAAKTIKEHKPIVVMSAYHKPNDKTELPALMSSIASYDCELRHDCEEDFICRPI